MYYNSHRLLQMEDQIYPSLSVGDHNVPGLNQRIESEIVTSTIAKNPHFYIEPEEDEDNLSPYRTISERVLDYPDVVAVFSMRLVG